MRYIDIAHGKRTADLAVVIGVKIGYESEEIINLKELATFHDIGKSIIPARILNKPGELSKTERKIIETHSIKSQTILLENGFSESDCFIVRCHHEKLNGTGYPDGITEIPVKAQIITVADIYDALTSHRGYRTKIFTNREAIEIMENDSGINQEFVNILKCLVK
ncbi:HD-GYP domain-containing protein [Ruminiclostridium cellobioparum]|uniref:HD-GYP domain-containing protein n=1 Tax=Ruminiclostridium cellobioparum TaxID=29355 RepID=UPI0028A8EF4D|nr:HD domain-containing phosphohydrolase [Ruminiclostridium cellobioparum]